MNPEDAILDDQGKGEYVGDDPLNAADIKMHEKAEAEIQAKYYSEQRKERRQQMKLACLQMANQAYPDGNGGFAIDPVKVLAAAKEYYKFVRT